MCLLCVLFYCHLTCLYYVVFHEQINGWMDGIETAALIDFMLLGIGLYLLTYLNTVCRISSVDGHRV